MVNWDGPPEARTKWHGLADVLQAWWPEGLAALGTVGFAVLSLIDPHDRTLGASIWGISSATFLVGSLFVAKRRPTRGALLRENRSLEEQLHRERMDYWERLETYLATLANDILELSDQCRISLYRTATDRMECVGRYSKNVDYNPKRRAMYPLNQGCIGKALRDGKATVKDAPDPHLDGEGYYTFMETKGHMPREVMEHVSMKSRHLLAYALLDTKAMHRIGVVAFESANDPLDEHWLDALMHSAEARQLAAFLEWTESPEVRLAEEKGF